LIGLRLVAENPDRFARIVVANTGMPTPAEVPQERKDEVREFRDNHPPLTMEQVMGALGNPDPKKPELTFAHWQKWNWETADIPIGMMIMGTVDGRTLSGEEMAAYDAPFPDPSFKMGTRAMPSQVPMFEDSPSVEENKRGWEVLQKWEKPLLCAFSDNDPVSGGGDVRFRKEVPGAKGQPHVKIKGGGHFLQEGRGVELAGIIADFIKAN
jgi:haloalkane dehalogenase